MWNSDVETLTKLNRAPHQPANLPTCQPARDLVNGRDKENYRFSFSWHQRTAVKGKLDSFETVPVKFQGSGETSHAPNYYNLL